MLCVIWLTSISCGKKFAYWKPRKGASRPLARGRAKASFPGSYLINHRCSHHPSRHRPSDCGSWASERADSERKIRNGSRFGNREAVFLQFCHMKSDRLAKLVPDCPRGRPGGNASRQVGRMGGVISFRFFDQFHVPSCRHPLRRRYGLPDFTATGVTGEPGPFWIKSFILNRSGARHGRPSL